MITLLGVLVVIGVTVGVLSTRAFEPVVGFPGGALARKEAPVPDAWAHTQDVSTIQLETRPADPYSVNLWGVGVGKSFYVSTRPEGTGWSRNVDADPQVRLRVQDAIYAVQAVRIESEAERDNVLDAYATKYESDRETLAGQAAIIYRLEPRS